MAPHFRVKIIKCFVKISLSITTTYQNLCQQMSNRIAFGTAQPRKRKRGDEKTLADIDRDRGMPVLPIHLLFECATGYALFLARDITQVDMRKFEAVEEYVNRSDQPFELKEYLPFSSHDDNDALVEINAISKSTVSDKLKEFLERNFPRPTYLRYSLGVTDGVLGGWIVRKTGVGRRSAVLINDVMRGLREKIYQLIDLQSGELEKAQIKLARLYINQNRTEIDTISPAVVSSSSSLQEHVVPHRFEGFFNVKGKENILCTRNLVPGEALYGEKLIHSQNEDRTEVQYRVWDPLRSKLGATILGGVSNIWIKPGARVLYVGNVCGLTVADLSDLVGLDGLVYVVGFSDGDDVGDMAGKRPNVVTITEKFPYGHWHYRMLVGMVDVMFGEIDHCPDPGQEVHSWEVTFVVNNARFYLRAGGHYLISTQENNSAGHVKDPVTPYDRRKEFKPIETIVLDGAYTLYVGGYRI